MGSWSVRRDHASLTASVRGGEPVGPGQSPVIRQVRRHMKVVLPAVRPVGAGHRGACMLRRFSVMPGSWRGVGKACLRAACRLVCASGAFLFSTLSAVRGRAWCHPAVGRSASPCGRKARTECFRVKSIMFRGANLCIHRTRNHAVVFCSVGFTLISRVAAGR